MVKTVLIYLEKDNSYLMLYRNKKDNDYNKEKWIGIGGKIEQGETIEEALCREVKEETNLDLISYTYRGLIHFIDTNYSEDMYLFTSTEFKGMLKECNEGTLSFIKKDKILNLNLWEGDPYFLKKLFENKANFELTLEYKNSKLVKIYEEK